MEELKFLADLQDLMEGRKVIRLTRLFINLKVILRSRQKEELQLDTETNMILQSSTRELLELGDIRSLPCGTNINDL